METSEQFDYIIAGSGAAGCVIARRLLDQSDATVLLLEAGGPDNRDDVHAVDVPTVTSMWGTEDVCWQYQTVPQSGCHGRRITIAQGKVVGGGTSVNALIYVRGSRRDYDHWNQLGNTGWGYDDIVPYFKRAESYPAGDPQYRGSDGPLVISDLSAPSEASTAFVQAAKELGFPAEEFDYNGARQDGGAFFYQSTRTAEGRRCSAATAYLGPVLSHPRLTVRTGARVARVALCAGCAAGVEYLMDGRLVTVRAASEVIVCCGAFATPQVLMLSGIGPAAQLRQHGLNPVANLPGVGRNLQDHMLFGVGWECRADQPPPELLAEAGLFTHSRTGLEAASPDLQFFFGPVQFLAEQYRTDGPGFTFAPILIQPRSRGEVTLRSADPLALPVVDPHYLEARPDADALVAGIELARELAHTSAFDGLRGRELAPGAALSSRADLEAYVRQQASTVWHPAGTCQMGYGPDAVVDDRLRVHGIEALRVADASVMPVITSGNTEAAVIAIAERAADLIIADCADHRLSRRTPS
jgi:choline dehydrogenase